MNEVERRELEKEATDFMKALVMLGGSIEAVTIYCSQETVDNVDRMLSDYNVTGEDFGSFNSKGQVDASYLYFGKVVNFIVGG